MGLNGFNPFKRKEVLAGGAAAVAAAALGTAELPKTEAHLSQPQPVVENLVDNAFHQSETTSGLRQTGVTTNGAPEYTYRPGAGAPQLHENYKVTAEQVEAQAKRTEQENIKSAGPEDHLTHAEAKAEQEGQIKGIEL